MPNGRVGHQANYFEAEDAIYIFAGQIGRDEGKVKHRELQNDLWKIDLQSGQTQRVELARSSSISRRIYTCGFMISQYMYAIGGLSIQGECLQEIVMMNVSKKECKVHNIQNNPSVKALEPLCSMQCVAAFYSSRFITENPESSGSYALDLDRVSKNIDWSIALSLIKYEGIYCFGGRTKDNVASNKLFCIQV